MFRSALRLLLAVLLLAGAPWSAAADAAAPKGSLVIIGGNLRPTNAPVWERIVQLAGGKVRASPCSRRPRVRPNGPARASSIV